MKKLTVDAQVANLKAASESSFLRNLHRWMLGGAVVLAILSTLIWNPIPLMIAAFIGIVGLSGSRAIPNVLNALLAYDTVAPSFGEASISITRWSDDYDYHVILREEGQPDWTFDFIPQGWEPIEGTYSSRIWRLNGCAAPVLAVVDDGILIPRRDPEKLEPSTPRRVWPPD